MYNYLNNTKNNTNLLQDGTRTFNKTQTTFDTLQNINPIEPTAVFIEYYVAFNALVYQSLLRKANSGPFLKIYKQGGWKFLSPFYLKESQKASHNLM